MPKTRNAKGTRLALLGAALILCGCRNEPPPTPGEQISEEQRDPISVRGTEAPKVEFPLEQRSGDAALDEFIDRTLNACVRGEYGIYRMAVGSQYEPLPRRSFERAWRAVKEVRIRRLMLVHDPDTQAADTQRTDMRPELKGRVYCAHATITLRDPRRSRPVREIVVLLIQENGEWKLGPPAPLALKYRIMGIEAPAEDLVGADESPDTAPAAE